ncbi:bifunctional hydroxymethylpyrimidine kinase/phosphomethylpyrimidine kinase [Thiotrichales bacterium 19S11-10]|nr:bifunctional hydroxymethylpyrimidine kinase/phosphomethylpyrimidine kinase [Thiotrichales bacterium 19S11-10]
MKKYNIVLTIAGSDSSGGAGIQADIKTITALNCYAASVINALTAQNTQGVLDILPIPAEFIKKQLDAIFEDFMPNAIKIGMLHNKDCILAIQEKLKIAKNKHIPIILDPVMVAQDGSKLINNHDISALSTLLEYATLITPNMPEAKVLANQTIDNLKDMEKVARYLGRKYQTSILLKGGHLISAPSTDILYLVKSNTIKRFKTPIVKTKNNHGTGCTLSSAISAFLAHGYNLEDAIIKAKDFLYHAMTDAKKFKLGHGSDPVNHLFNIQGVNYEI